MNDTTFQGSGNVAYVPVIVNDKLKRTNADRIRSMTDEELADWLSIYCHGKTPPYEPCHISCEACWLDWLRQEATDG